MSIIQTVPEDQATGEVAALYADDLEMFGYVTEHTKVMALNPDASHAFDALTGAISAALGVRNYRLVTLAAAGALHSQPCLLAHGLFARKLFDDAQLERIARDFHDADLTPAEVAMMDFAVAVCVDAAGADASVLREHGFDDAQIVNIALAAGARNHYSRALSALGIADPEPPQMPSGVREALLAR